MAKILVVADASGFVGAFATKPLATSFIARYRASAAFVAYEVPLVESEDQTRIFVLPHYGTDSIAYASNSLVLCRRVQSALLAVGLTYDDDVERWEQKIGTPCARAVRRLEAGLGALAIGASEEEAKKLDDLIEEKEQLLFGNSTDEDAAELERVTIADCIVPSDSFPPAGEAVDEKTETFVYA